MQLAAIVVEGLFGKYTHRVLLPTSNEEDAGPSVVILHGPNGVGKTTVLRMLSGMMQLDFTLFRAIPFTHAHLDFNGGQRLTVDRGEEGVLAVSFEGVTTFLHPEHSGPWRDEDSSVVKEFREAFHEATESLTYKFLGANRVQPETERVDADIALAQTLQNRRDQITLEQYQRNIAAHTRQAAQKPKLEDLAKSVQRFISDAQLDHGAFFRPGEPDLFLRIIGDLTTPGSAPVQRADIRASLIRAHSLDVVHARLGLGRDTWDFETLSRLLDESESLDDHALAVIGTYAEFIESRANTRQLVAERLVTFEQVVDEFLTGKSARVDARRGLTITSDDGSELQEAQLSSGEYQLLYLMVAALTTRRRGTVIAIDEPELSMHIAWQRRLVPSLIRCASRAAPQLILATHSPDIAAGYPESMVELGVTEDAS